MARPKANIRTLAIAAFAVFLVMVMMSHISNAERVLKDKHGEVHVNKESTQTFIVRVAHFLWQGGKSSYEHVWPVSVGSITSKISIFLCNVSSVSVFFSIADT